MWFELKISSLWPGTDPWLFAHPKATKGDPWGDLAIMRETPYEFMVEEVSARLLSTALYGHSQPLFNSLKNKPESVLSRLTDEMGYCRFYQNKRCPVRDAKKCHPRSQKLPTCYDAPTDEPWGDMVMQVCTYLARGFRVIVPVGTGYTVKGRSLPQIRRSLYQSEDGEPPK